MPGINGIGDSKPGKDGKTGKGQGLKGNHNDPLKPGPQSMSDAFQPDEAGPFIGCGSTQKCDGNQHVTTDFL